MVVYEYTNIINPAICCSVRKGILESAMDDKQFQSISWDEDTELFKIEFLADLSVGDKAILDGIVASPPEPDPVGEVIGSDKPLAFDDEQTKYLIWNSTDEILEFNGVFYAPEFVTDKEVERAVYMSYFPITGGTMTSAIYIDTDQSFFQRWSQTSGGTQNRTGYYRCNVGPTVTGWGTTAISIDYRVNSTSAITFSATVYINGVADSVVDGVTWQATTANVWETETLQPADAIAPGDKVNIHITATGTLNGAYGDVRDLVATLKEKQF